MLFNCQIKHDTCIMFGTYRFGRQLRLKLACVTATYVSLLANTLYGSRVSFRLQFSHLAPLDRRTCLD